MDLSKTETDIAETDQKLYRNEMLLGTRESSNFVLAKFACSRKHPTVQFEYSEQGSAKHCRLSRWWTGDARILKRTICKPVAAQRFSSHGSMDVSETKFSKNTLGQKRRKGMRKTHVSSDAQGCFSRVQTFASSHAHMRDFQTAEILTKSTAR